MSVESASLIIKKKPLHICPVANVVVVVAVVVGWSWSETVASVCAVENTVV